MRTLVALLLSVILCSSLRAGPPDDPSRIAGGRGALSSWADLAGTWTGSGTSGTAVATIESLFGGRCLMIQLREDAGEATREELSLYVATADRLVLMLYDSTGARWEEVGAVEPDASELVVEGSGFVRTLRRTAQGIELVWVVSGQERGRWKLSRGDSRSVREKRRGLEQLEVLAGEFKGTGEAPGARYDAVESCKPAVANKLLVSRQRHDYPDGRIAEVLTIYGESDGALFSHVITSDGLITPYKGQVVDTNQFTFKTRQGEAEVVVGIGGT